jgi:two-component system response regulator YesN
MPSSDPYRLLIVDDERPICEGLMAFAWGELGFEAAGSASNGEEALAILAKMGVDVILTDIKMPFIDGIELCCRVRKLYPKTKMVLLTGHKDFEYARAAVGIGVSEYLLKPVDIDELRALFLVLKDELDACKTEGTAQSDAGRIAVSQESGLINVVQAVLDGKATEALRLFRCVAQLSLPPSVKSDPIYCRDWVPRALRSIEERLAANLATDRQPPEAPPFRSELLTACASEDEVFAVAADRLSCLVQAFQQVPKTLAWAYAQKALAFINQHCEEKISMSQVAEFVGLNESYFSQTFKKETGSNFVDYLRDLRISKAIELMKTTDLRIYQIGLAVGYDDAAYFASAFRRCTGFAPLDYKRRLEAH